MIETRHGLESNPVPTSIFDPKRARMAIKLKIDVGTGLDVKYGEFDDSRTGRLRYIYSTLSIYLARVELSEMLEKAYIPRRSEFGGFLHARDFRAIPT